MRIFTTGELSRMQGTNEVAMMDEGVIVTVSYADDAAGQPIKSEADLATVSCGFDDISGGGKTRREVVIGEQTVVVDAVLRLPIANWDTFSQGERFRLTKRFGATLPAAQTYDMISLAHRGPAGIVVNLKKVIL